MFFRSNVYPPVTPDWSPSSDHADTPFSSTVLPEDEEESLDLTANPNPEFPRFVSDLLYDLTIMAPTDHAGYFESYMDQGVRPVGYSLDYFARACHTANHRDSYPHSPLPSGPDASYLHLQTGPVAMERAISDSSASTYARGAYFCPTTAGGGPYRTSIPRATHPSRDRSARQSFLPPYPQTSTSTTTNSYGPSSFLANITTHSSRSASTASFTLRVPTALPIPMARSASESSAGAPSVTRAQSQHRSASKTSDTQFRKLGLKPSDHGDWDKAKIDERIKTLRTAAGLTDSAPRQNGDSLLPELSVIDGEAVSKAWQEQCPLVMSLLHATLLGSGTESEHTASGIIETFLKAMVLQTDNRLKYFPEHRLSSAEEKPGSSESRAKAEHGVYNGTHDLRANRLANPTILEGTNSFRLRITANIDYLVLTHKCDSQFTTNQILSEQQGDRSLDESVLRLNLDRLTNEREETRTSIIEAKSWGHSHDLKKYLPQAVLQSLILMKKANRDLVSWCLSTSIKWYFGVTWIETRTRRGHYVWFCPPDLPLTSESFKPRKLMEDRAQTIYELLTIWSFTPPELLRNTMFPETGLASGLF